MWQIRGAIAAGLRRYDQMKPHHRDAFVSLRKGMKKIGTEDEATLAHHLGWKPEKIQWIKALGAIRIVSIDAPLGEDGNALIDLVPADQPDVEEEHERARTRELVRDAIQALPEMEAKVLQGVILKEQSQEQVARKLRCSRQYVSMIQKRALGKLSVILSRRLGYSSEKLAVRRSLAGIRRERSWKKSTRPKPDQRPIRERGMYARGGKLDRATMLLRSGIGIRETARLSGSATGTVGKLYRILTANGEALICPCGHPSNHRGMCSDRFRRNPLRQEIVRQWHTRESG